MAQRKLLYIAGDYQAEHEPSDSIRLGALGIGSDPDATGIKLTSGDLALTGSSGIDISGSSGVISGLPASPTGATEAASKAYVDNIATGNTWRPPVITMEMISDALATAPGSPADGDSYVTAGVGAVNITAVNTTTETFTVAEDKSGLGAGDVLLIKGSTGNDGYYTVASTSGTGPTDITVNEDITDATADGTLDHCTPGDTWDTVGPEKIVTYNGTSWDVLTATNNTGIQDGDRVVVKEAGNGGSFTNASYIYEYNGTSWDSITPANGWSVLAQDYAHTGYYDNTAWVYEETSADWVQFNGAAQITAGLGLTKTGNTLNVGAGNGISVAADTVSAAGEAAGAITVTASGIGVTPHTATDGSGITIAGTDEILVADADDSWDTKRVTMAQVQDYISSAGLDFSIVDGNGIADFSYNGSAGATVTVEAADTSIDVGVSGISVGFAATVPGLETADGGVRIAAAAAGNGLSGGGGSALAVDINDATDGSGATIANNDQILFADTDDSNNTKRTTIAKLQDAIAAENADLTDGNGILDFTYDGGSAASIAVSVTDTTDGTSLDLATGDEFLFADASDSNATKKTSLAKIQAGVAALNSDLTDGNGIADFTYDGSSPATIVVEAVSVDRISVGASGIDVTGVPSSFKINGSAVSSNVTQTNVDTLVDGVASVAEFHDASALHAHKNLWTLHEAGTAGVTANYAVRVSAANEVVNGESDSEAGAQVIGVALDTAADGVNTRVVSHGVAAGVLTGATPGAPYYVDQNGALTATVETGVTRFLVRMGYALNATDLMVHIVPLGRRAAA